MRFKYRVDCQCSTDTFQEFFVALCGGDGGNQWKTCTYEHPPHTVAVHAYDLEFATIKSKVEQYHTVFGRPIALTELAMRNVSNVYEPC